MQKIIFAFFMLVSSCLYAVKELDLYKAPLQNLQHFTIQQPSNQNPLMRARSVTSVNTLEEINKTQSDGQTITRYQQLYKGILVVGAQIMVSKDSSQKAQAQDVNGRLVEEIELNVKPSLSKQQAIDVAKQSYLALNPQSIKEEVAQLQIRPGKDKQLILVYLVSFKSTTEDAKPLWPFFVIDAHTGSVLSQWDNVKTYMDRGPGGNEKVREYWYGWDGLPLLEVTQNGLVCIMDNNKVRLVNLATAWDWNNTILIPHQYYCNNNAEDYANGSYSAANDAYYFGSVVFNMYKDWYHLSAIQNSDGTPKKLIMRVHFGKDYDNAFWDGVSMSFGDGYDYYPLVSLDIAGHEITHGFTEQHSDLEYHDESGSIDEAVSDMAGMASRAYLLEKSPALYNRAHTHPNVITWGIGETLVRGPANEAMRYMNTPSKDGISADCLDKKIAKDNGSSCKITYSDVVARAKKNFPNPRETQAYIVHTASGIFNKAFYLLSINLGIRQSYNIFIRANLYYWTPSIGFNEAACGVVRAGNDLKVDIKIIKQAFGKVGVETRRCTL